jgi:hypothetical protein
MLTFIPTTDIDIGRADLLIGEFPVDENGNPQAVKVGDVLNVNGVSRHVIGIEDPRFHSKGTCGLVFGKL